jgi:hypothetical protein
MGAMGGGVPHQAGTGTHQGASGQQEASLQGETEDFASEMAREMKDEAKQEGKDSAKRNLKKAIRGLW